MAGVIGARKLQPELKSLESEPARKSEGRWNVVRNVLMKVTVGFGPELKIVA